jgi:hypothetical protein
LASEKRRPKPRPKTPTRDLKRQLVQEIYEKVPCAYCGETDPDVKVLHHLVKGSKFVREGAKGINRNHQSGISYILVSAHSLEVLIDELRKCVVLCANCHMRVHKGKISVSEKDLLSIDKKGILILL